MKASTTLAMLAALSMYDLPQHRQVIRPEPDEPTQADYDAIAKAEAKRERKRQKLIRQHKHVKGGGV